VIAFEPAPFDCAYFGASVRVNGLEGQVQVIHAAASDRPGTLRLIYTGRYAHVAPDHEPGGVEVPMVRVGEVLSGRPADVGLVKLDVEGHEPQALAGLADGARTAGRPPILYESNEGWLGWQGHSAKGLRRALAEAGYGHHYLLRDGNRLTPVGLEDAQAEPTCDLLA